MKVKEKLIPALLLAAVAFSGCPTQQEKLWTRKSNLAFRVQQYHECLYWKEYERASLFVAPERRMEFLAFVEQSRQGYTLDNFSIKDVQISPSGDTAAVVVKRSFVLSSSPSPQMEEITQPWVLLKGEWFVAGPPY